MAGRFGECERDKGKTKQSYSHTPQFEKLLSYSTDSNMCRGAIRYQDETGKLKRQPALFMNVTYFNNLRKYATEEGKEVAETKRNERLEDLKNSKLISQFWWDTPENLLRAKEGKKLQQKKLYEEESARILHETEIANRETERKILADAKVSEFQDRQDIKELLGACLLSEVLNEEAVQIDFKEKINKLREEKDKTYYEDEKKANSEFFQKEAEKKVEKRKAGLKYGRELQEQANLKNKQQTEEKQEEKKKERAFFAALNRMKKDDIKGQKQEEFLQNLKNHELECKFIAEERQRDEEVEDKHIKDYQESVLKMKEAIKKRNEEKRTDSEAKKEALLGGLNSFKKEFFQRELKEKENMEKDAKRLKEREEQRVLDDGRRHKQGAADFLAANIEQRKQDKEKREALFQKRNFDLLREMKQDDDCKKAQEKKYRVEKEKQAVTRAILKEQMASKVIREEKEREEMENFWQAKRAIQKEEDEEFLAYARSLMEKSKSNGRDIRPMEKLLKISCKGRQIIQIVDQRKNPL